MGPLAAVPNDDAEPYPAVTGAAGAGAAASETAGVKIALVTVKAVIAKAERSMYEVLGEGAVEGSLLHQPVTQTGVYKGAQFHS